jgi:hypothetical protein
MVELAKPDAVALTSKFYCGSEEGDLLYADWIVEKKDKDEKNSRVEHALPCYAGAISDLQRSPFFPDIILCIGGSSFQIWKETVTVSWN